MDQSLRPDTWKAAPTAAMLKPPNPPTNSSRRDERPNQARHAPATSTQAVSEASAIVANLRPSKRICPVTWPADLLTNCGRIAARNTIVLGLVAPTVSPWRNEAGSERGRGRAALTAAASDRRSLNVLKPR